MISKLNGNEIYDNRMPVALTRKIYQITLPIGESSLKCRAAVVGDHVYVTNFYELRGSTGAITSLNINWASRQYNDNELPLPMSDSVPYAYAQSDIQAQISPLWNMNPHPDEHHAVGLTVNQPAFQIILNALPDDWGALQFGDLQQVLEYSRQNDLQDGTYGAFIAKYESSDDWMVGSGYTSDRSTDKMGLGFHVYGYLDGTTCQMTNLGSAYFWNEGKNLSFVFNQQALTFVELSPNCACNVAFKFKGTVDEFYKKYVSTSKEYLTYTADGDFQFDAINNSFDSIQIPDLIIPDAVTDADGFKYSAVILGNQVWMAENLHTTHTANGDLINSGTNEQHDKVPYYYHVENNSDNDTAYGLLYNFPAAMIASPTGWHLPIDAEWTTLAEYVKTQAAYVSGENEENIAKALASTINWNPSTEPDAVGNNQAVNNATGFNAMPVGGYNGEYVLFGANANFWSATLADTTNSSAYYRQLTSSHTYLNRNTMNHSYGFSVRCICDQSPQEFLFNWLLNHNGYYKLPKTNGFEYKLSTSSDVNKIFICNANGVYEPITISELKAKLDSLN